jgi:hypothetical protein
MVRPKGASWIVTYDGSGKEPFGHKCLRCGDFCKLGSLIPLQEFLKISATFIKKHRQCQDQENR